ncbi:MAG: CopG family transcriptional regulator [Lachnospiraceae bacterium]|nr:CopG family transcriptional regulator [Lachnospiraceae bacterium]
MLIDIIKNLNNEPFIIQEKDWEQLNCRVGKSAFDKLSEICRDVGLTKAKAVEKAIEKFYEEYKKTGKV